MRGRGDRNFRTLFLDLASCLTQSCVLVFTVTGFADDKGLFSLSPGVHTQHNLCSYSQLPHHAFQQYQLGGVPEGHSLKSDSGLVMGATLWDLENSVQPGSFSGSPGQQPGSSHAGGTELCCLLMQMF